MERALGSVLGEGIPIGYAPYGTEGPLVPDTPGVHSARPLRLAWVGRMEEAQKRTSDLVPILHRCQELGVTFTCDIVGDGPSSEAVRNGLVELESDGKVRFRGYLSREELYRSVYPGLDALLLTSNWETGPIVAWEAMRHGACLVSSRYVGLGEEGALVDGKNCLLAEPGDAEGLARAVVRLEREEGLQAARGARAELLVHPHRERPARQLLVGQVCPLGRHGSRQHGLNVTLDGARLSVPAGPPDAARLAADPGEFRGKLFALRGRVRSIAPVEPPPETARRFGLKRYYRAELELDGAERSIVVLTRLVLSTLLVEFQIAHAPHIADEVAAERPGTLDKLGRWLDVDPATAANRIREML